LQQVSAEFDKDDLSELVLWDRFEMEIENIGDSET